MENRKAWLDNIRWMTIVIVVIYHVFFYYNNIGIEPMFAGLAPNPTEEGAKAAITAPALFQYFVYPWFMLLLFVVSGIVTNIVLQKKGMKEFLSERVHKLLIPSTLGILTIQWVGGYLISQNYFTAAAKEQIPGFVLYIIYCATGIGALWFCQVLFVNSLLLALIKKIDKKNKLLELGGKANLLVLVLLTAVFVGAAQLLNAPITTYRMCLYPVAFLVGYYICSNENVQQIMKKYAYLFLAVGILADIAYIIKNYGAYYAYHDVQNDPIAIVAAWFMVLGILGMAQKMLNFSNVFTNYMNRAGWGIYILHINLLLLTNTLLKPVASILPMVVIYLIEMVVGLAGSVLLWEILRRIPVIRWLLFGIRRKNMLKDNLIMLRRANNLSQEEVAEKINISRQAYAKWEKGETVPDIEKCAALAELYGTTLNDLYKEEKMPDGKDIMPAPKGKHLFGTVTVNDKGQIVIPKKAREVMNINPGDDLIVLADEQSGLALVKANWFEKHLMNLLNKSGEREE